MCQAIMRCSMAIHGGILGCWLRAKESETGGRVRGEASKAVARKRCSKRARGNGDGGALPRLRPIFVLPRDPLIARRPFPSRSP